MHPLLQAKLDERVEKMRQKGLVPKGQRARDRLAAKLERKAFANVTPKPYRGAKHPGLGMRQEVAASRLRGARFTTDDLRAERQDAYLDAQEGGRWQRERMRGLDAVIRRRSRQP